MDGVAVARRVLELAEVDDFESILNLAASGQEQMVTKSSQVSSMRKLYLKLSLVVHPDKLGKSFSEATRAFQAVIKAFEELSNPPENFVAEESSSRGGVRKGKVDKPLQIERSNENCFRTRILCPRCKERWSENTVDGNPDYYYNFLMTGLKQYYCSTCLCEFGCMTAIHLCPFCTKRFDYYPSDFHLQKTCPNPACNRQFGFFMYHASDRVIKDLKKSVKEELDRKMKAREAKQRRAARSRRGMDQHDLEQSFLFGLCDICPRCGEDFTESYDETAVSHHLMNCNDENKHRVFQRQQAQTQKKQNRKEVKQQAQENAATEAAFQFLGAQDGQLWLLDEDQLQREARRRGVQITDSKKYSKDDIINLLVDEDGAEDEQQAESSGGKRKSIEGGASSSAVVVRRKRRRTMDADDIPSNLHGLSLDRLRSILVAHGLHSLIPKGSKKCDLIELIEDELLGDD